MAAAAAVAAAARTQLQPQPQQPGLPSQGAKPEDPEGTAAAATDMASKVPTGGSVDPTSTVGAASAARPSGQQGLQPGAPAPPIQAGSEPLPPTPQRDPTSAEVMSALAQLQSNQAEICGRLLEAEESARWNRAALENLLLRAGYRQCKVFYPSSATTEEAVRHWERMSTRENIGESAMDPLPPTAKGAGVLVKSPR